MDQENEEVAVQKKGRPVERSPSVDIGLIDVEPGSEQLENHVYAGMNK